MKTKYELLQEYSEKIKDILEPVLDKLTGPERDDILAKIDQLLINTIENPKDLEDEIPWNESEIINDLNYNDDIDLDNEFK